MKENKYETTNEVVYSKKLSNGLTIYFYPTDKTKNFYLTVSVKYGAKVTKYTKNDKTYFITPGSAHFLEHKIMNFETYDIMKNLGSVSNAYTTYDLTNYNIFGSELLEENIKLLLDLLFHPVITEENVESEKGIIKEEIDMEDDNLSLYLYNKMRENLFSKGYQVNSVIGKSSDIETIKAKDLLRIYEDFYRTNNMFMIVCGNFDKTKVLDYIENYFKQYKIKTKKDKIKIINESDNIDVKVKYEELEVNTLRNMVLVGIKIPKSLFNVIPLEKLDAYFYLIKSCKFSSTSKLYEKYKNDNIIYSMSSTMSEYDDYYILYINANVVDSNLFIENIKKDIKNFDITKSDFERKKKKFISKNILSHETIECVEDEIVSDLISYDKLLLNIVEIVKNLNYEEAKEIISRIDFSNYSIIKTIKK